MPSPYLNIEHLQKSFGNYRALHDISLQIEEGEFVCFLGPSGCGKTTLLRAIAGLEPGDSGRIIQGGQDVSALAPSLRDFGIVFQSYALFPNLSVAENIGYGLVNSKVAKAQRRERVAALLQQVDLPGIEDKFPAQLSGGQQQRVALARALAMEPGLLLLDEPLSALDARVRQHLRSEICQLQRKLGITTIMVTHDQEEALTMADRIVVMNAGEIVQQGTPQQIYQQPVNAFVANFIGSMNLLDVALLNPSTALLGGAEYRLDTPVAKGVQGGQLGFRPECVKLGEAQGGALALKGVVSARIFMGAFSRLRIALDQLSIELDVGNDANAALELGQWVDLNVAREDVHFYPHAAVTEVPAAAPEQAATLLQEALQ